MGWLKIWQKFWRVYERHYTISLGLTGSLFILQLVHLYWLTAHVVALRLWGLSFSPLAPAWQLVIALVDYTEIPALLGASLVYVHQLRQPQTLRSRWITILFLVFLNIQWLHLFWITDEVVLEQFTGNSAIALPIWLSWLAIGIDYLELPVIIDTIRRFLQRLTKQL